MNTLDRQVVEDAISQVRAVIEEAVVAFGKQQTANLTLSSQATAATLQFANTVVSEVASQIQNDPQWRTRLGRLAEGKAG